MNGNESEEFKNFVDAVNGPGPEEFKQYDPTRCELLLLARHWAEVNLGIQLDWYLYGQTGSTEIRLGPFANRRLDSIAEAIGDAAVHEVVTEIENEARERMGDELWEIFINGDEEQWDAVRDHIHEDVSHQLNDSKRLEEG